MLRLKVQIFQPPHIYILKKITESVCKLLEMVCFKDRMRSQKELKIFMRDADE